MTARIRATLEDLAEHPGKAELVNGEIVPMAPTGDASGTAGDEIYYSLRKYVERVVRKYTASDPANPVIFRRGEVADAEPAVPGWRMNVDDLFR